MMTEERKRLPGRRPTLAPEERMVARNVTFPPRQLDWLEAEAQRRNVTVSSIVREAVAHYMAEMARRGGQA